MDGFDFNGGNAEIMQVDSNLENIVAPETLQKQNFEQENKLVDQEINGDAKLLSNKKNIPPAIKKKLRKLKTGTLGSIEEIHKPEVLSLLPKSIKRKISETLELSSSESEEFNGFDHSDLELFEPDNIILKKLIAEAELINNASSKRRKITIASWEHLKNADNLIEETDENTTDSEDQKTTTESDHYHVNADESSLKSEKSVNSNVSLSSNRSRKSRSSRGASPGIVRQKVPVDITNPAFREPFNYGWKRELVYRAGASENQGRRMADIYYYTPEGKKVRSYREVIEFLKASELTIDNFTFFKEPLGINDPNKEIIRDAKKAKDCFNNKVNLKLQKKSVEILAVKRITPKKLIDKFTTVTMTMKTSPKTIKTSSPTLKVKIPPKKGILKREVKLPSCNSSGNETSSSPPWNSLSTRRNQSIIEKIPPTKSKKIIKIKVQEPCSIRCSRSMGLIPTLHCTVCLCLYHPECTGIIDVIRSYDFICKNCQLNADKPIQNQPNLILNPPPLIPISTLNTQNANSIHRTALLPRLQLIPKIDSSFSHLSVTSKIWDGLEYNFNLKKKEKILHEESENKFFHKYNVFLLKSAQNIALMDGKKFIVIPKNNVMTVQSAIASKQDKLIDKLPFLRDDCSIPNSAEKVKLFKSSLKTQFELQEVPKNATKHISDCDKILRDCKEINVENSKKKSDFSSQVHHTLRMSNAYLFETMPELTILNYNCTKNLLRDEHSLLEQDVSIKLCMSPHKDRKKQIIPDIDNRQYFMVSVCAGYHALSRVFQYLKVQELLRAARVCRMWRDLAAHPSLWKTVRMKNSQVTDWDGLADTLKNRGTQHLDLRKMLIVGETDNIWKQFVTVIPRVKSLTKLELCRCPAMVVEEILKNCPQLKVLSAMSIRCDSLDLESINNLKDCNELRLKAINGMSLRKDLTPLLKLFKITHLSLTSIKDLGKQKIEIIKSLGSLEVLELGECSDFPEKFGTSILIKLQNLERLRLEKGQGSCCTFDILEGISKLEKLTQLELVNFDVKNGFDKYLANCKNIKRLLIIPTYVSQSATSNNMILGGVTELSSNLTHFVWGVTQELLRVTELFVDQCNQMNKQITGDSIPVLKPVPCLKLIEDTVENKLNHKDDKQQPNLSNPQVEILPLPHLQKLLLTALPKTRVKILKIPFHATWRQSISDSTSQ